MVTKKKKGGKKKKEEVFSISYSFIATVTNK